MFRTHAFLAVSAVCLLLLAQGPGRTDAASPAAGDLVPGRLLVRFRDDAPPARIRALLNAAGAADRGGIPQIGVRVLQLPPQASETAMAQAFARQPEVEFAEVDQVVAPDAVPNDPWFSNQWQLSRIEAPAAWDAGTGAQEVIIAVLDTGVDASHEDLAGKMVPGWNTWDENVDTSDVSGHGTRVAGTAAASGNNGRGVASLAWGCRVMPIRISDPNGYAATDTAAAGLIWAADRGARVANISYDFSASATVVAAAQYFQERGGVVTISAGNQGTYKTAADNPYVLTVTAADSTDTLASWSNRGTNVDLAAPMSAVTTARGGGYVTASGTSFSAPTVAGVAALVLSVNPGLSGAEAQEILKQSADDRGAAGWDDLYGWGRINARKAVLLASGQVPAADTTAPTVRLTAPAAGAMVSGKVTLTAEASDNVGVAAVSFTAAGTVLATSGTVPYSAAWDSTTTVDGTVRIRATATDAAGNVASSEIDVTVRNNADTTAPTVSLTSPGQGATLPSGTVTVSAAASDNVGVTRVEFYVDGSLTSTCTSPPFSMRWNTKKLSKGSYSLQARAYDAAGNSGTSAPVTVYR